MNEVIMKNIIFRITFVVFELSLAIICFIDGDVVSITLGIINSVLGLVNLGISVEEIIRFHKKKHCVCDFGDFIVKVDCNKDTQVRIHDHREKEKI
jgi:hypothetical protein